MDSIAVKDLAPLVLKAYIHFGVKSTNDRRLWLTSNDLYAAQKAVAASFGVLNEKSLVNIEQINQRGREIACENNGALYKAWCGIKNAIENDLVYEDCPFEPAKSIDKSVILCEYLQIGKQCRPGITDKKLVQEFKALTAGFVKSKLTKDDILEMQKVGRKHGDTAAVENLLYRVAALHFTTSLPPEMETIDSKAEIVKEKKGVPMLEEKKPKKRGRAALYTAEEFQEKINEVYGQDAPIIVGEYLSRQKPIRFRCPKCGDEWTRRGDNAILHPFSCPSCAARKDAREGNKPSLMYGNVPKYKEEYFKTVLEIYGKGKYEYRILDNSKEFMYGNDVEITYLPTGAVFTMEAERAMKILRGLEGDDGLLSEFTGIDTQAKSGQCDTKGGSETVATKAAVEENSGAISLFNLQKYYNKAYAKHVGDQLTTGWKSMTNSMREVMPEKYPYEKVSYYGKHINVPVNFDDIEWIAYYYADMAKTPTTDSVALTRAARNSKVWGMILEDIRKDFGLSDSSNEDKDENSGKKPVVQQKAMKSPGETKSKILTIEEQREAKRRSKERMKEFGPLMVEKNRVLSEIDNTPFSLTINSAINLIVAANELHPIPDVVKALIANILEVNIANNGSVDVKKLSEELEQAKQESGKYQNQMKEMQRELDDAKSSLKIVKEALASA